MEWALYVPDCLTKLYDGIMAVKQYVFIKSFAVTVMSAHEQKELFEF